MDDEDAVELRRLRETLGLSQRDLATAAGVAENTVVRAERPDLRSKSRLMLMETVRRMAREQGRGNVLPMARAGRLDWRMGDKEVVEVRDIVVRPGVRAFIVVAADAGVSAEDIQSVVDQLDRPRGTNGPGLINPSDPRFVSSESGHDTQTVP